MFLVLPQVPNSKFIFGMLYILTFFELFSKVCLFFLSFVFVCLLPIFLHLEKLQVFSQKLVFPSLHAKALSFHFSHSISMSLHLTFHSTNAITCFPFHSPSAHACNLIFRFHFHPSHFSLPFAQHDYMKCLTCNCIQKVQF